MQPTYYMKIVIEFLGTDCIDLGIISLQECLVVVH